MATHNVVEAHCYDVDNGELILSMYVAESIQLDCRTFEPHWPSSTVYKTVHTYILYAAEKSLQGRNRLQSSCYWFCYISGQDHPCHYGYPCQTVIHSSSLSEDMFNSLEWSGWKAETFFMEVKFHTKFAQSLLEVCHKLRPKSVWSLLFVHVSATS